MSVTGFRSYELKYDEVREVVSGIKRKRWSPTHDLAMRILVDLVKWDLHKGYTDITIQWGWVAERLEVTEAQVGLAIKLLSQRKILVLKKMSAKGKQPAIWTVNDLYLVERERKPKRAWEVFNLWTTEFGSDAGKEKFFEALISIRANSKRATARALIDFGLQMLDDEDATDE